MAEKTEEEKAQIRQGAQQAGGMALGVGGAVAGQLVDAALAPYYSRLNYKYNELAANASDERTRALFTDLYSPEAKVKQLKKAGLSVGLMYGQGGASGTSSTSGAQGAGGGHQQGSPTNVLQGLQLGLMNSQIKALEAGANKDNADAKNKEQDRLLKEQQTLKLTEEVNEVKERVKNIVGERALQGWSQRQLMTISDSELKSYSEGAGWTKGWSEGASQGTSQSESKQGGGSIGVTVLKSGGNVSGNYGYSESESQNTSESKSENKGANTSKSETTSTSGSRNVVVWPKYDEKGKLEHLYMVVLNGDYKNISMEFRQD